MSRAHHELHSGLPSSIAATIWALGFPLVTGAMFVALAAPYHPPLFLSALLTIAAALAAATVGSRVNSNFSELLLWNWLARLHAERRLAKGTLLLDFDALLHSDRLSELRPRHDLKVLTRLAHALERKDLYTLGHSRRVARQSCRIAAELGLNEAEIQELAEAAALHDVGKIRVPDAVLQKKGPLTVEEFAVVQEHPEVGAQLVSPMGRTRLTAAVLHHHESWDGRGYPRGLEGEDIPLFARIISVADAHDAMTSDRPYRKGLSHNDAVTVVKEQAGRQFDPRIVAAFERSQQRHVVVPALMPALMFGRRLLRAALTSGSAASPAAAAATATAVLLGSGLAAVPTPQVPPSRPPAPMVAEVSPAVLASSGSGSLRLESGPARSVASERLLRSRDRAASAELGTKAGTRASASEQSPVAAADPTRDADPSSPADQALQVLPPIPVPEPPAVDLDPLDPLDSEPLDPLDSDPLDSVPVNPDPLGLADSDRVDNSNGHFPPGDPQPDKGKDCERRTGTGRGKAKHCSWFLASMQVMDLHI
jgi:HD-GYP domain-containing protein (c-di-GMP phosphodiesterase class II)